MSKDIITTLTEERQKAWKAAKEKLDAVTAEKPLSAEDEAFVARTIGTVDADGKAVPGELDNLDARIAQLKALEARAIAADESREAIERAAVEQPETARALKAEATEVREWLKGDMRRPLEVASPQYFRSGRQSWERRDITSSSTGAPVPTSFYDKLTMHLVQTGPMWDLATVLRTGSGENLQFPRTTAHGAATFKAEGSALDETQPTFGAFITLGAWKNGTVQQWTYELLEDTGVDLLGYIAEQAGVALAVKSGTDFTVGNDTNAPNGIVPASTLGVTGATGVSGAFTADNLIDLLYSVGPQYRRLGASWQMRDTSIAAVRKLKDGTGNYLFAPGLAGSPDTLLGYPLISNPDVVATATSGKSVIFGAASKYMIRQAGPIRFERSDEFAFTSDLVTFKIAMRYDGDLLDQSGAVKHFIGGAS
jgi:HK97 family phage major capsid protein